jgi:UDP-N-acetylmuramoylalanine--D-glutamate ligase
MIQLEGKKVVVLGQDPSGEAALALVRRRGAEARLLPAAYEPGPGDPVPDVVVLSAGCQRQRAEFEVWASQGATLLGERELAFQLSLCLHVAVSGASGKQTTSALIAHILRSTGRRVEVAEGLDHPASAWVESSRDLEFLVHGVEVSEFEFLDHFRPVVAVLLNAPADHLGPVESWDDHVRRLSRLFARQQAFDWAILQAEALAHFRSVEADLPGKVVSFSAFSRQADLGMERGLLVSRWDTWTGPLWDMARGRMRGPHFAENVMAALAVGRVLRLSLDDMVHALDTFEPGPGCLECLGESGGVRYIDDGRCRNLDALVKGLMAVAPVPPEQPSIWLIAGGASRGRQFYDVGPVLSPRVKHAVLYGEAAPAMRAAWSIFTPCTLVPSLLDAAHRAVAQAASGETVLYSPACPSSARPDQPPSGSDVFREVVRDHLTRRGGPTGAGASDSSHGTETHGVSFSDPPLPPSTPPAR